LDERIVLSATIVGRYIFYNNSYLDGKNAAANASDDAAIDASKQALLPGQIASSINETIFGGGINGVMIDISHLTSSNLTAADFNFKVGNSSRPADWSAPAAPTTITVRSNQGTGGSSRVTLVWNRGDGYSNIFNEWLQVTVKADSNTGLASSDVFYFGNLRGDANGNFLVDNTGDSDLWSTGFTSGGTKGGCMYGDFDLNGVVDSTSDYDIWSSNFGSTLTKLTAPLPNWFDSHIQDAALRALGSQDYQDGLIDRNDMIGLFRQAEVAGPITATEMSDLQLIVNTTALFGGLTYVDKLAGYIVLGNSANANYQGQTLGNLAVGSSATQLETLVDKWFLGTDHPATSYAYSQAAGTLFVNGAAYTDVRQGALNDCAFVSSLAETALRSNATITSMFIVNGDGTYTVRFYHSGIAEYVTVDSYLPASGGYLVYAHTGSSVSDPSNELWVSLAEKAYAQIKEMSYFGGANAYSSVEWQYAATTLGDISGQSTVAFTYTSGGSSAFATAYNAGKLICLISYDSPPNVVGNHSYTVVSYDAATNSVTVFNPWGIEYGLLTLSWSQVQANFMYFDRTA
jgi:hypothetical protein